MELEAKVETSPEIATKLVLKFNQERDDVFEAYEDSMVGEDFLDRREFRDEIEQMFGPLDQTGSQGKYADLYSVSPVNIDDEYMEKIDEFGLEEICRESEKLVDKAFRKATKIDSRLSANNPVDALEPVKEAAEIYEKLDKCAFNLEQELGIDMHPVIRALYNQTDLEEDDLTYLVTEFQDREFLVQRGIDEETADAYTNIAEGITAIGKIGYTQSSGPINHPTTPIYHTGVGQKVLNS